MTGTNYGHSSIGYTKRSPARRISGWYIQCSNYVARSYAAREARDTTHHDVEPTRWFVGPLLSFLQWLVATPRSQRVRTIGIAHRRNMCGGFYTVAGSIQA